MSLFTEWPEDVSQQYINARATFQAWLKASTEKSLLRGSMSWTQQNGKRYLVRKSAGGGNKGLGVEGEETLKIYHDFVQRRDAIFKRVAQLDEQMAKNRKLNRVLRVGRCPNILIEIVSALRKANVLDHFLIIGTHALYVYETLASVTIDDPATLATRDVDLLWDVRKRAAFVTNLKRSDLSMIGLLRTVDETFERHGDQVFTAVNATGFEVDIIRREPIENDPHPCQLTENQEDLWAMQARRASQLMDGPRVSAMVVSVNGSMEMLQTIAPSAFVDFKRWMSTQNDREPVKRKRDRLQADTIEQLIARYL